MSFVSVSASVAACATSAVNCPFRRSATAESLLPLRRNLFFALQNLREIQPEFLALVVDFELNVRAAFLVEIIFIQVVGEAFAILALVYKKIAFEYAEFHLRVYRRHGDLARDFAQREDGRFAFQDRRIDRNLRRGRAFPERPSDRSRPACPAIIFLTMAFLSLPSLLRFHS